jgi:hypothetical protein
MQMTATRIRFQHDISSLQYHSSNLQYKYVIAKMIP